MLLKNNVTWQTIIGTCQYFCHMSTINFISLQAPLDEIKKKKKKTLSKYKKFHHYNNS